VQDPHVDSIEFPELFRGTDNEFFFCVDNPADVVGDPSGGKGCVGTPFEDDDIQIGPAALCLGSGAHPGRIASDNDQSFFRHGYSSLKM
jgi:hypothetical protein